MNHVATDYETIHPAVDPANLLQLAELEKLQLPEVVEFSKRMQAVNDMIVVMGKDLRLFAVETAKQTVLPIIEKLRPGIENKAQLAESLLDLVFQLRQKNRSCYSKVQQQIFPEGTDRVLLLIDAVVYAFKPHAQSSHATHTTSTHESHAHIKTEITHTTQSTHSTHKTHTTSTSGSLQKHLIATLTEENKTLQSLPDEIAERIKEIKFVEKAKGCLSENATWLSAEFGKLSTGSA